jgi:fucose permease
VDRHPDPVPTSVGRARRAVLAVFAVAGWQLATWLPRLPGLRDRFALTPQQIGLVLLAVSAGAVLGLPLSGVICHRIGPARTIMLSCTAASTGMALVGFAGVWPLLVVGLFLIGAGSGIWDVAMNLEGAAVEQRLGRAIMPHFHAAFSLGTVVGALLTAAAVATGVSTGIHLTLVAGGSWLIVERARRDFLPMPAQPPPSAGALRAWREPRTLSVGLLVLAFSFAEGSANEWLALAFVDGYGVPHFVGALCFAMFVGAMTCGRLLGPYLLARGGRVRVLRASAGCAAVGVLLVSRSGAVEVAALGTIAWGLGASLGFPVGMSAAADDPERAPARVSAVSTIGYSAYLAGPPLLGGIAQQRGVLFALLVVPVLLLGAAAVAGTTRPLVPDEAAGK